MPSIIDLATSGLRRSTRAKSQPQRLSFFSKVCALGLFAASIWTTGPSFLHDRAQNLVFASVNQYHAANQCFDGTLNCLHHMALAAGKQNNETYTFKDMLKQEDAPRFISAMLKEVDNHEKRGHWEVNPR